MLLWAGGLAASVLSHFRAACDECRFQPESLDDDLAPGCMAPVRLPDIFAVRHSFRIVRSCCTCLALAMNFSHQPACWARSRCRKAQKTWFRRTTSSPVIQLHGAPPILALVRQSSQNPSPYRPRGWLHLVMCCGRRTGALTSHRNPPRGAYRVRRRRHSRLQDASRRRHHLRCLPARTSTRRHLQASSATARTTVRTPTLRQQRTLPLGRTGTSSWPPRINVANQPRPARGQRRAVTRLRHHETSQPGVQMQASRSSLMCSECCARTHCNVNGAKSGTALSKLVDCCNIEGPFPNAFSCQRD